MTSTEKSDCTMKIQGKCIILDNYYLLCPAEKAQGVTRTKGTFVVFLGQKVMFSNA